MRCFVAVWPPADVVEALAALPRATMEGLRWSTPDQWHVTLRFFGELNSGEVASATAALGAAAASVTGPLSACGGPESCPLGPSLVIWPVEGLEPAARVLQRATAHIGEPVPDRQYFGHVTLARGRRGIDLRSARHLFAPLEMRWPVASVSLVRSELRPTGACYRTLESVVLNAPQG